MDHCAEDPLGPSIPNHDANACIEKRMVSEKYLLYDKFNIAFKNILVL